MSLREAFLASPLVTPGSAEAQKMTVTSGLRCSAALTKSSPIGSFVRTLLESSRWWSKARLLQWQVRPLYSTRTTIFKDTNSERPLPFNESATTSQVTDTKSNRFLFRLAVLERRTDETEFSSSDTVLLQTPTSIQTDEPPEKMRERAEKRGYKNGTKYGSLTSQIKYDPRCVFLKTPCMADSYTDYMKSKGISGTSGTLAQEVVSGYATKHRGLMLPTHTARDEKNPSSPDGERIARKMQQGWTIELNDLAGMNLLPTPTAIEGTKYTNTYNPNSQMGQSLSAMAGSGMLPTPIAGDRKGQQRGEGKGEPSMLCGVIEAAAKKQMMPTPSARDWKGETNPGVVKQGSGCVYGETLPDAVKRMEKESAGEGGGASRLSPLFTEEMMGFPFLWTTLPFLSQSGAQKPSKPTGTQ